ncbi:hypothetical protein GOV07_03155 [Candidatus Woesearchaeota archaeon]|nr:hypothetical protein [Candidatus Woesearchaeota archaeon]
MNLVINTLEFSKLIISIFIMFYAYYFLRRSEAYVERRPWVILFFASMFLFVVELVTALQLFRGVQYGLPFYDDLRRFAEFAFLGFFLFSFIYQHKLLLERRMIVINQVPISTWYDKLHGLILRLEKRHEHLLEQKEERKMDEELAEIEEEQELKKKRRHKGPTKQEIDKVTERAKKLIDATEELLQRHAGHIDKVREALVRDEMAALKEAVKENPVHPTNVERHIKQLLKDDSSINTLE